ncbi:hypothetical protein SERLADRAFT_459977 [Serpula lacrymans var. lacrymans S7.9]|uniref:Uncharacterized protein n=1 Tax=Serpula lacrymans var. lacrymans (strain S7.9) TaxID=578457 RepID=F8NP37_SERL9|nr:uncharacterized protein SERLADRAFT_459977 [Serpula lacrymans var. lacrymans S7.9]EGO27122.1 hypothetical protein SERLADRAFT_459977 [Serpula lacrymans var. lacrymans S7.9]
MFATLRCPLQKPWPVNLKIVEKTAREYYWKGSDEHADCSGYMGRSDSNVFLHDGLLRKMGLVFLRSQRLLSVSLRCFQRLQVELVSLCSAPSFQKLPRVALIYRIIRYLYKPYSAYTCLMNRLTRTPDVQAF